MQLNVFLKVAKQRKHRTSSTNKKETKKTTDWVDYPKGYVPANGGYESTSDTLAKLVITFFYFFVLYLTFF